ncbi:hypothetical protein [Pseudomonas sp. sia0905]|uniref:hypothetical protein n=1 Tax=Pseudomonas sp. sia0905 TaxID=2854783 RepID=UPI001C45445E|nr:hypothetical protein [Pseudomonas sp. sia0905]MBV7563801.1 hypothetical protein [Pseudomonas sp. sia0905]
MFFIGVSGQSAKSIRMECHFKIHFFGCPPRQPGSRHEPTTDLIKGKIDKLSRAGQEKNEMLFSDSHLRPDETQAVRAMAVIALSQPGLMTVLH